MSSPGPFQNFWYGLDSPATGYIWVHIPEWKWNKITPLPFTPTLPALSSYLRLRPSLSERVVAERIHLGGCVTTTRRIINQEVRPILVAWISLGCILLVVDISALLISLGRLFSLETSKDTPATRTAGSEEMPLRYTSSISLTLSKNHL